MAKILVLEKDPVQAWAIQSELMMHGDHTVIIDDDPRKALPRVFKEHCELVIADYVTLDGNWLCSQLRKLRPGHDLPVILMGIQQPTADSNVVECILRKQVGCDDYIPRPFDVHKLAQLIDILLLRRKIKSEIGFVPTDESNND